MRTTSTRRKVIGLGLAAMVLASVGCAQAPLPASQATAGDLAVQAAHDPGKHEGPAMSLVQPDHALRGPNPVRTGNHATMYATSHETLPALQALIASAERSLWFETFNFGNDSMGQQIYPRLIEKARAGVQVKVIMDYVGSRFLPKHAEMVRQMRAAGVDVRIYKPRWIVKDDKRRGINIQHRKVYLADGVRALTGGVNLMHGFDTHTEDVLVRYEGPIVRDLAAEWAFDWKASGGDAVQLPPLSPPHPQGEVEARVVVTSPAEGRFEGRDAIYAGLDAARRDIIIANQYLWDDGLVKRLHAALGRGVKVRVVVPGDEDHGPFKALHAEEMKKIVEHGGEARLFTGTDPEAHLHTKFFGVDDAWVAIGSTNGDTRALLDNQELDTIITDPGLAQEFRHRMFMRVWERESKPFVYVPGGPMTRPFRTLLEIIDYYL